MAKTKTDILKQLEKNGPYTGSGAIYNAIAKACGPLKPGDSKDHQLYLEVCQAIERESGLSKKNAYPQLTTEAVRKAAAK